MKPESVRYLNALNQQFYNTTATAFDETRQHPWAGWARLVPHVPATRPLRLMDIGCGNGRFMVYLRGQISGRINYLGVDSNAPLLDHAVTATAPLTDRDLAWMPVDIVEDAVPVAGGQFELVVLFGVMHHVPGKHHRLRVLRQAAERVAPGGVLAFTAWRFMDNDRLRNKIVDWTPNAEREPGDYLLDWRRGTNAIRYCHYINDDEHAELTAATGLTEVDTYRADGPDGQTNRYSILRRGINP